MHVLEDPLFKHAHVHVHKTCIWHMHHIMHMAVDAHINRGKLLLLCHFDSGNNFRCMRNVRTQLAGRN